MNVNGWMVTWIVWSLAAQCPGQHQQWDKRFGGLGADQLGLAVPTPDGGFLIGGNSDSDANGDKTQDRWNGSRDYWVVKTDANGVRQWDRRWGGFAADYLGTIQPTADGGYILGGESLSGAGGDRTEGSRGGTDVWIVKTDADGNPQWDRRFGGDRSDYDGFVRPTADGGYVVASSSASGLSGDKTQDSRGQEDYWILKLDASGRKQWDRRFGTPDRDFIRDVLPTRDGGYLLGGATESGVGGDKTQDSRGQDDFWVVKVSANGAKEWDRRFGGSGVELLAALAQTADGGYLLGGQTASAADGDITEASRGDRDLWVVKIDARGNKQWDRRLGGSGGEYGGQLQGTADEGVLLGGQTGSPPSGEVTENSRGLMDYWIVKLDAQGRKRWDKRFGGAGQDYLQSVWPTADGGYIVGGESQSGAGGDRTEDTRGGWDFWVVKIGAWPADAYEFDDTAATAKTIANGQVQCRNIHEPGDQDMAQFRVRRPGGVNARIETSGAAGDTEVWVTKGSSGALMGHNDDIGGANHFSRVDVAALEPGTYFIRTRAFGNQVMLPAYTLQAEWVQQYAPDAYEADTGRRTAPRIRNGQTLNRNIHQIGDRDWGKFTVGVRGGVNVLIETRGARGDTQLWLYDQAGRRLAFDDDSGKGRFARIRMASLAAGTYYLRVKEKGEDETIAAYTMRVRWTPR